MNRWFDWWCPNGCGVWIYQYGPGGPSFERNDVPHICPAPTTPEGDERP